MTGRAFVCNGVSRAIREVRLDAEHAAQCDAPMLVVGERGVGKEFMAVAEGAARVHSE